MKIVETKEIIENDIAYIVEIYDDGHIVKKLKPSDILVEPEIPKPTQLDLIQQAVEKSNNELRQEGADALMLELINKNII